MTTRRTRGLALIEVIVIMAMVCLLVVLLLPLLNTPWRPRAPGDAALHTRDAAQVREIHKGLIMWAQQNSDAYPLPSEIDAASDTITVDGDASRKNASGSIYSILVYNGLVMPDVLISPLEPSDEIVKKDDYEYYDPSAAVNPSRARWDPAFRGTPRDIRDGQTGPGNVSYAHLALAGPRRMAEWRATLNSDYPVLANRGPEELNGTWDSTTHAITGTALAPGMTGTSSITLRMHGFADSWEGNVAYNDNHVIFETTTHRPDFVYQATSGEQTLQICDGFFLDEANPTVGAPFPDLNDINIYLGLFRVGPTAAQQSEHGLISDYISAARWFDGQD
ncbi:MAG: hypothetical protein KAS72_03120 [Phycisphaerales bacterium]|nr:hypothetical protein [Phycisphaerales bacterium]